MKLHSANSISQTLSLLNSSSTKWLLLWNISDELPSNLPLHKDIDILVCPNDSKGLLKYLLSHQYRLIPHPTRFEPTLYGMPRPYMLVSPLGVHLDIQLCLFVRSLDARQLCPLDSYLQDYIWSTSKKTELAGIPILMPSLEMSYTNALTRSIFNHRGINKAYAHHLTHIFPQCSKNVLHDLLRPVFFAATSFILDSAEASQYETLYNNYIQFSAY